MLLVVDAPDGKGSLTSTMATTTVGRIVETEAYNGESDPASHAFGGETPRNRSMFLEGGHLYVYRSYGVHWCANVVCQGPGQGAAVLVRAIEPVSGLEVMKERRGPAVRKDRDLGSGPGKLCAALGIEVRHDGIDLLDEASAVRLMVPADVTSLNDEALDVVSGPRVGISKAVERPWRFALRGNPHVSTPRSWEKKRRASNSREKDKP